MKKIEFINEAAQREYADLPKKIKDRFALDFEAMVKGDRPFSKSEPVKGTVGPGAYELKKNGSPAYRLVYCDKGDTIFILSAFSKTTNGVDKPAMKTAAARYSKMIKKIDEKKKIEKKKNGSR